ncbi:MAG: nucleoside triphosphate pyrophosphohydrolase [Magnetococcales bacterium]|nr:nucleoside triphosphate pyrophosphohydrolase [Magnetococcales bacterium]NGZ06535.1 nucleoside triphosphate pyrophosphohydrolase [Magnetococcales bacterium]
MPHHCQPNTGPILERLEELMACLRGPEGCPWDREQTPRSLLPYTIEEAFEVVEAVETRNIRAWKDELGDLLFHIVFHSRIAQEEGHFTLNDVISGIVDKMTRRHPHVFDPVRAGLEDPEQVVAQWEVIKRAEKSASGGLKSVFDDVNSRLPALLWAAKVQRKMSQVGFDWSGPDGVLEKVHEELEELRQATTQDQREEELGDLLLTLVNLAGHYRINPEMALRRATHKSQNRFRYMEQKLHADHRSPTDASLDELEALWQESKRHTDPA